MKILLISPVCPLPLEKGGAVRIFNIARELSHNHTIDLVCFIRQESELRYEEALKKVFNSVTFIRRRGLFERSSLSGGLFAPLRFVFSNSRLLGDTLVSSRPLLSHLYYSDELLQLIKKADREGTYDLFYAETFYSIATLKTILPTLKTKLLLIEQNIESVAYSRQADQQKNSALRTLMLHDVTKIEQEERYFWTNSQILGGLSHVDCSEMQKVRGREVLLLENGVDVEWFNTTVASRVSNEVLFVGSFSYFPNIDSLRWLLEDIWPLVRSERPDVSLRIVGRGADSLLKKYVHDLGHTIDESVDDIRTSFQQATLLIAPLRSGSGTKYKVLEAMASHLPVVTTAVGAEGLQLENGTHALIQEQSKDLAGAVLGLLNTESMRHEIARKAYDYVVERYDWKNIVTRFEQAL